LILKGLNYLDKNSKKKLINLDNLALDIYNDKEFATSYASKIEYNSHNALYERPATLSLLPDVKGKKVLDAGCGPGEYTSWLLDRGAVVTAVDYSDEMLRIAKEKAGGKAKIVKANLNETLDFLNNEEFDIIVSSMVVHYIKDLLSLFSEFNRILKTGGVLVFSTGHPLTDYILHPDGNYFETELIVDRWRGYSVDMPSYRRSLSELFNVLKQTDFRIDELLEPQPLEECKEKFPDAYEELTKKPWFIFFRVIKEK